MEKDQVKIPIVNVCFKIVHLLQYLTSTSIIHAVLRNKEKRGVKGKILTNSTFKGIVTFINIFWLLFSIFIVFYGPKSRLILALGIFRLWEIFIINTELFVFKQSAVSPNSIASDKDKNIRLFLLIVFQFFTVTFIYTYIYQYLYISSAQNFFINFQQNITIPSAVTWLHYSIGNISNTSYGNIVPLTDIVRTTAITEIIYGYIFIVLFIANIIGKLGFGWIMPSRTSDPQQQDK